MRGELRTLTSLRFFAALAVVLFHVVPAWLGADFNALPAPLVAIVANGFVAVPFFFLLSGFVLHHAYAGAMPRKALFWAKRFARIAPVFYLSLALGALLHGPRDLAVNALFLGAWWPPAILINFPGWSISAEAFFYLLFPFLLPKVDGLRVRGLLALGAASILASAVVPVLAEHATGSVLSFWPAVLRALGYNFGDFLEFNPLVHAGEFVLGVALGACFARKVRRHGDLILLAGAALSCVLILWGDSHVPESYLRTFLPLPAFALVIWGAACPRGPFLRWLEASPLRLLGEASYAIYVLHQPMRELTEAAFGGLGGARGIVPFLAVLVLVSVLVFLVIENPARAKLNAAAKRSLG